ncbi:MAG: chemotaxis-specific protein-glutamate methyltransferase CheB [Phycisphaerales bacterium]
MRIAIVNDLRLAVEALRRAVATIPGASVAWIAEDGAQAVAKCATDVPDIILMDMIMPVMDGVEATRRIMSATPCPILVVTATVDGNSARVFEALGAGALDAVETPGLGPGGSVERAEALVRKVNMIRMIAAPRRAAAEPVVHMSGGKLAIGPIVAIGASTGGPQAIAQVLRAFPKPAPWPVVIVQHVDPQFAAGLASWLTSETRHDVRIAQSGDLPLAGRIYIGATEDHVVLDEGGKLRHVSEPKEIVFRPSVDVFFDSLVTHHAAPGVAVVLTGMGRDGANGLFNLRKAGWQTIAQDKATSVVWGMPGASVEVGAAGSVLPCDQIGGAIVQHMSRIVRHNGGHA